MYVYLYDNFLRQKKYESTLKAIETRLTDFGVAGKIVRLQSFTNSEILIQDEIRRGAKTIVIVGDDDTVAKVLSRSAATDILFGFIPVGGNNTVAEVLGIPIGELACTVLSQRRKVKLDIGWVNNRYFISQLHVPASDIKIEYDEKFTVSSLNGKMELVVCNLQPFVWKIKGKGDIVVHPQDGKLEAFLRPAKKKKWFGNKYEDPSIFPFEEMSVSSYKPFEMEVDGKSSKETRITIRLAKSKIKMIVGKDRKF